MQGSGGKRRSVANLGALDGLMVCLHIDEELWASGRGLTVGI